MAQRDQRPQINDAVRSSIARMRRPACSASMR
jgi:hypothetical protein